MLDRRGFLKFIGGAAVGTLATPVVWQGLDDLSIWSQNWPWIPSLEYGNHENTYIRTVSKLCPSAVGTRVRLVGERPVRVLGDPDSPLSLGGISALAATEVQMRYSPARLKRPLKRTSDGAFKDISWEEAEALLMEKMKKAKGKDGVVCVSGDENGTMNELFSGFTAQMGSDKFFLLPGDAQATATAWKLMGGKGRVGYDFAQSDFILAVGANVLESWGTVVANRRAWGNARPSGQKPSMRLAFAGAVENNTASGADWWLPIKPGTEMALLMGIAHQLILAGIVSPGQGLNGFKALAAQWTPEKVCEATGLSQELFVTVLREMAKSRAPLVIVGSEMDQGSGAAPIMAGIALNMLLGRLNRDGGLRAVPVSEPLVPGALSYEKQFEKDLVGYAESVASGKERGGRVLLFYEANPVYALPDKLMDGLFQRADFSVSFSCFLDETARRCDLILPSALGLERYDDVTYPFGYGEVVYALAQPVVEPLYQSRPAGEVLIDLFHNLGLNPGFNDVIALLQAKAAQIGADWNDLSNGNVYQSRETIQLKELSFRPELLREAAKQRPASDALTVAFVHKLSLGTAETAIPPFNTKTITRDELVNNTLVARVNGATLKKLRLYEGNLITVASKAGKVTARLKLFEGVTNDTVALTMGFGHTAFETFNGGKGMNVMTLISPETEPGTGLTMWTDTRITVAKA